MINTNALQPLFDKFAGVWSDVTTRLTGVKVSVSPPGLSLVTSEQIQDHLKDQCALAVTMFRKPLPGLSLLALPFPLAGIIPEKIISPESTAAPAALSELHAGALKELTARVWAAAGESFAAKSPAGFEIGETEIKMNSPAKFIAKTPALAGVKKFLAAQYQIGIGKSGGAYSAVQLFPADFLLKAVPESVPAPAAKKPPAKPAPPKTPAAKPPPAAAPAMKVKKVLDKLELPRVKPGSAKNKQDKSAPPSPEQRRSVESLKRNLGALLDIPVEIKVELGAAHMGAGDLLGIGPGSVVELDSMNGQPVRVMANGQLIARGQVVAVGEKFGIRIVEMVKPEKRIMET